MGWGPPSHMLWELNLPTLSCAQKPYMPVRCSARWKVDETGWEPGSAGPLYCFTGKHINIQQTGVVYSCLAYDFVYTAIENAQDCVSPRHVPPFCSCLPHEEKMKRAPWHFCQCMQRIFTCSTLDWAARFQQQRPPPLWGSLKSPISWPACKKQTESKWLKLQVHCSLACRLYAGRDRAQRVCPELWLESCA